MLLLFHKLLRKLKYLYRTIKGCYLEYKKEAGVMFRLVEINREKQRVCMQVRGRNHAFTQSFSQVIGASTLIQGMSSEHACCIGFYHGLAFRNAMRDKETIGEPKPIFWPLDSGDGRYRLTCQNRDRRVEYYDKLTKKCYCEL